MAITGDSFMESAWNGFLCDLKYMAEFFFARDLGKFFIIIAKLSVVSLSLLAYWGFMAACGFKIIPWFLWIFTGFFCLLIVYITLGLFMDAIISSLMCMAVDSDLNNGNP